MSRVVDDDDNDRDDCELCPCPLDDGAPFPNPDNGKSNENVVPLIDVDDVDVGPSQPRNMMTAIQ
jgi:hypothetical protein